MGSMGVPFIKSVNKTKEMNSIYIFTILCLVVLKINQVDPCYSYFENEPEVTSNVDWSDIGEGGGLQHYRSLVDRLVEAADRDTERDTERRESPPKKGDSFLEMPEKYCTWERDRMP